MRQFLRRWLVEIVAALAAIIGVYLLVEQTDIGSNLWEQLGNLWIAFGALVVRFINGIRGLHVSDLLGVGLIVLSAVLIVRRIGQRMRVSSQWSAAACPVCGHGLRRLRRRPLDIVTWFFPLRRFRCANCGWSGLRAKAARPDEVIETVPSRQS